MRQDVNHNGAAEPQTNLQVNCVKPLCELTSDRRQLVVSHFPIVYAMAWVLRGCGVSLDDLRQEGALGLCEAAMRYDENIGSSFAAYASYWCRKMMLMAIHRHGKPVRLPEREQRAASFYSLDVEEKESEICDGMGKNQLLNTYYQEIENEDQLRRAQQRRINDVLQCLSPLERQVVKLFYGIDCKQLSLTEIAVEMGFSASRAATLHAEALPKLEREFRRRPLVDYLSTWLD